MCHEPYINSKVLLPDVPWVCTYCTENKRNPYVETNPFEENEAAESSLQVTYLFNKVTREKIV